MHNDIREDWWHLPDADRFRPPQNASMRTHTRRRRLNRPGNQHLWGFDNGHLASAVPDTHGKHLWALTVLDGSGRSTLGVPSNTDVMGSLTAIDVRRVLRQIEALR